MLCRRPQSPRLAAGFPTPSARHAPRRRCPARPAAPGRETAAASAPLLRPSCRSPEPPFPPPADRRKARFFSTGLLISRYRQKRAPRGKNHSHSCYTPDFFSSFDIDEALFPAYWRYHAMFPRPLPHAANAPPPAALRFMLHLRQTPMRQDGSCSAGWPPRRQPAGRACRFFGPGRGGGMHSESPGRAHHGR